MTPKSGIEGRLAVVTGAARGIGRSIAEQLMLAGARVIATDKDADALDGAFGGGVDTMQVDLAADEPASLAAAIVDRFGPPELIVNNVGIASRHRFLELEEDAFDLVFSTNVRGPWFFTKRLVQELVDSDSRGSIVFISSLHDHHVRRYPHYSASKAAVAMLVRELAYELASYGIRVNAVSPGWVPRERAADDADSSALIPLGRAGTPEEVAKIVLCLLSDELAGYVTGTNVPVDGGLGLHNWLTSRENTPPPRTRSNAP